MGGYPAASDYRFAAHKTGLKELIAEGKPIPLGGDTDPENPIWDAMLPNAQIKRDKQVITIEEMFADYDLYLNSMRGGPGFGDPLDRDPQRVADDLNGGYTLERFAARLHGAIVKKDAKGAYTVDADATKARRAVNPQGAPGQGRAGEGLDEDRAREDPGEGRRNARAADVRLFVCFGPAVLRRVQGVLDPAGGVDPA